VESENPLPGLYAAVTRQDAKGNPPGGWLRDQTLTLDQALRAFTIGAAWARFDEKDAGVIEAGMRADLTVLDRDITKKEPAAILLDTHAKYTIVRGSVVYERP
jgi:predicted amidohydrolase YtcJ